MEIYPAVDIQGGRLARAPAPRGADAPDEGDPLAAAAVFVAAGARWIHVVDLDRAYGRTPNPAVVQRLLAGLPAGGGARAQVGGGLTSELDVDQLFTWGAARVIVGAKAVLDGAVLERVLARHGAARLAVGLDVKDGRVAPRGTRDTLDARPDALARRAHALGIRTVVYTDVTRDGALRGPDLDGARALTDVGTDVIVSGGIASLDDLRAAHAAGLAGAIVGRALHEGRFTLAEALACVA